MNTKVFLKKGPAPVKQNKSNNRVYFILCSMAEILGLTVIETSFHNLSIISEKYKNYRGFCYGYESLILINSEYSPEEMTFTLAHELGHYVLHSKEMTTEIWANHYMRDTQYTNQKEAEADQFAKKIINNLAPKTPTGPRPYLRVLEGGRAHE